MAASGEGAKHRFDAGRKRPEAARREDGHYRPFSGTGERLHDGHVGELAVAAQARMGGEQPRSARYTPEQRHELFELQQQRERRVRRLRRLWRAYMVVVALLMFAFQFWGCLCDDPEHGHSNSWNKLPSWPNWVVHTCGDVPIFHVSRHVGPEWCITLAASVAAHFYVTIPLHVFVARYYSCLRSAFTLLQGAGLGAAQIFLLTEGVGDRVLQGIDRGNATAENDELSCTTSHVRSCGMPTGAAVTAGLAAWLLLSASAARGYFFNGLLGQTMKRAVIYVVVSFGLGTLTAYHWHVLVGIGVVWDMLIFGVCATQVTATLRP